MKTYKIAVIPGDGIGKEVIPEGIKILETVSTHFDISFHWMCMIGVVNIILKRGK